MKKEEALKLVNSYFNRENRKNETFVMTYSSAIKKKIVRYFNFMKYRLRFRILRRIEISEYLKPDIRVKEKWMINSQKIYQTRYYWIVNWGLSKFIEELDIRHGLIGTGPIIVDKKTSRLFLTSTSMLNTIKKIENDGLIDLQTLREIGQELK